MRYFVIIFLFFTFEGFTQNHKALNRNVESLYIQAKGLAQAGDRVKAISLLRQILKADPQYYMAFFGLADIYHETGELKLEREALINGLKSGADQFPAGYKYLAELYYKNAEYPEALKNIEQYCRLKNPLTIAENRLLESCRFATNAMKSPVSFQPVNAGDSINTNADEYWPSLNGEANSLVFTRLVKMDKEGRKLAYPQEDFYVSNKDALGWRKATDLGPPVNTEENEGAQCISADGRLLFFTGCGRSDGLGSCDLYMSVKQRGKWSEPVNLGDPVNTNFWESQPSVSADGKWLYFTSNRKGGKGNMDIWRAEKIGVSPVGYPVYGKVTNLNVVNTSGNELSPFIHADGKTLYFASDFWPGMGGKDLFFIRTDSVNLQSPQNLGCPLNTSANEEGLVVEVSGERAWFTYNNKGFGGRDIFTFLVPETIKPKPVPWVKGRITDRNTGQLIFADITLKDLIVNRLVCHMYPFENEGEFLFCLPSGPNYGLNISKEGYLFHSENFNLLGETSRYQPVNLEIQLDPIEQGKSTILKNIFFATDSFRLKPESQIQLSEIIGFLVNNPGLIIEIGGHTDHQGSENYNMVLSTKRADAVVQYLFEHGIQLSRLKSKGYGFSVPRGDNSKEEGRALNRRIEFKILEFVQKKKNGS